ncbi:MAG: hypothetical protein ACRYFS_15195 [Janthinobacterium lividum]
MSNHFLALLSLTALTASAAQAEYAPVPLAHVPVFSLIAAQRQEHGASALADPGKRPCDYFIISNISVGPERKRVRTHGLLIVVTAWGQSFTGTNLPPTANPKLQSGEVLSVVLSRTADPTRMQARYSDLVYERGKVTLRFAGVVRLSTRP